ncbi:MAG: hypothetical protein RBT73_11105 [Spirochaetia bacterium]|jgi:hypothetical protein|nr:hypothetical protein [Spirochaetia bacterium]
MNKKAIMLVLIVALGGAIFAQTQVNSVSPKDASSMGMGGTFKVFSTGYDTFFGNPAGFGTKKGELTIADINTWVYVKPTQENIKAAQEIMGGDDSGMLTTIEKLVVENGFGAGAALGLGWAGKGFGLGLTMVTDEIATGSTLLGAKLISQTQGNLTVGLAFPFRLGPVAFSIGADARAFYKLNSDPASGWPFNTIITDIVVNNKDPMETIENLDVLGGYGFAFDAGATIGLGPFMIGAMVRDLGLEMNMERAKVGDVINSGEIPMDGTVAYQLKPIITAGLGFKLDLGLIAPSAYVEADDPIALIGEGFDSIWGNLHAGAELRLLRFLALRAGLNQGYLSLGVGLNILFLKVDAALFTEEVGVNPGDFGRTGIAIQAAIRF